MPELPTPGIVLSRKAHTAQWVIAVLLAFIAGLLWSRGREAVLPAAWAQTTPAAGARGVYAFTGQLDRNRFGLFMLDIEQGTVWCYEIDEVGGTPKLRLIAARSWIYDRYLRDFNCAAPDFRAVGQLVAQQRAQPEPVTGASSGDESSHQPGVTDDRSPQQP